jgi:cobalt-zinc-cadmium efflux system outer membrane protein
VAKRELIARLRQSHIQLQHLLAQAGHFKQAVLQPAKNLLRATERNYDIGAASSLALIDAYNTYFNARNRYLDIIFRSHQKAIDIKQVLGRSLLAANGTGAVHP